MPLPDQNPDWPEAIATVLSCRYDVRAGRAIAFGIPSSEHYRITYNYFANGEHHMGEFYSEKAVPQNTLFPIRYNPELPHEHSRESGHVQGAPNPRRAQIVVGVMGSVVLSLVWFGVLRGCH
jgi:hypothetical protein